MSTVLFYSTVVLNAVGVLYALVYIWLNIFTKRPDIAPRNVVILNVIKKSIIFSFIFALFSCLLETRLTVVAAIERLSHLYSMIAISWLVVALVCMIAMIIVLASKSMFKSGASTGLRKLIRYAIPGALVGIILSWVVG